MGPPVHVPRPPNRHERSRAALDVATRRRAVAAVAFGCFAVIGVWLVVRASRAQQLARMAACETVECSVRADLDQMCESAQAVQAAPPLHRLMRFASLAGPRLKTPDGVRVAAELMATEPGQRYARVQALAASAGITDFSCPALADALDAIR